MKIAYCFSGMIRHLDECGSKWKEIIGKNPGDVYGHFWETTDSINDNDSIHKFVKFFCPKKVEIENYNVFKESTVDILLKNINVPNSLWSCLQENIKTGNFISFHYKIWRANQLTLLENYDVVVRCRTDFYPNTDIKIEKNDFLNLPRGFVYVEGWPNSNGNIDLFAYGNRNIMNYYSSLYLYLMKYLYQGYYCYPFEHLLSVHLNQKDMKIRELPIDIFSYTDFPYNHWAEKVEVIYDTNEIMIGDKSLYAYTENRIL